MNNKNKTPFLYQLVVFAPMLGAFAVVIIYMANAGLMDLGFGTFMMFYLLGILGLFVTIFIHIIVHEAGHLVAGLKSGYKFSSFRIGSLVIVNDNGTRKIKKYSLAGTAGQCLMIPPELVDGCIPTKLYNWGGVIANTVVSTVALVLSLAFSKDSIGYVITVVLALMGYYTAVQNGWPAKVNGVANDGYNAINIGDDKKANKAFYTQLKVNALQMDGIRLKDMGEIIYLPDKADRENHLVATVAALYTSYLMDQHKFEEAKKLELQLIEEGNIIDIYRYIMQCDIITVEAMSKKEKTDLSYFADNKFVGFYKKMLKSPAIIRTEYAINRLVNNDDKLSQKALDRLTKIEASYMIASEIESEKEIIEIIKQKAK